LSRIQDLFGLDGKDITIHVGVSVVVAVIVGGAGGEFGYDGELVATILLAASAVLLVGRVFIGRSKHREIPTAEGQAELVDLDDRLYQLEQERARLHELEERVDFAERMLVSEREKRARLEEGR
jgi:hypothetical protein